MLTNDGELTEILTHPRYEVPKTYVARVPPGLSERDLRQLARGVELDDGLARARSLKVVERGSSGSLIEITITEGRNRQVRRMFEAVGTRVEALVRTSIGPLMLGRLKPGRLRRMGPSEVQALFAAAAKKSGQRDR